MALFDNIGHDYDCTRSADPFITQRILQLLEPEPAAKYLDVACGTGNYTIALAEAGIRVRGVDQSPLMIERARTKSPGVQWGIGDAESLPFGDRTFSGAICMNSIHHFRSIPNAFKEIYRVLDYGRLVILTATREQVCGYWLNEYFPDVLARVIERLLSVPQIDRYLVRAGFTLTMTEIYEVRQDLLDHFLYSKKQDPRAYLDPGFRAGMSFFATAKSDTVRRGCEKLRRDIATGRINAIMDQYRNTRGDYLFVVAEKTLERGE